MKKSVVRIGLVESARKKSEMSELGLGATEFGPAGFLPAEAQARAMLLNELKMEAIGGFFPIVIHRRDHDPLPVFFSEKHADRVGHVHMKDVNTKQAEKVRSGEISYYAGVCNNLYVPLGQGDIDMRQIVKNLVLGAGYDGWFVLEQDLTISTEPLPGAGPVETARQSVAFLRAIESGL